MEEVLRPENTTAYVAKVGYVHNGWNLSKYIWVDPSPDELNMSIDDRVWPAGEEERAVFILKEIKQPGEKYFPEGGYVCNSEGAKRFFNLDALIRHPGKVKRIA